MNSKISYSVIFFACLLLLTSCEMSRMRKQYNAINPKHLKVEYYSVKANGDTIKINYKLDLGSTVMFGTLGFPDTIVPINFYKGKRFTGVALSCDNLKEKDEDSDLLLGMYKTFFTYKNGISVDTRKYFPNDSLYIRVKGIYRGEYSELYEKFGHNGILLKKNIHQPGISYDEWIEQDQGNVEAPYFMGGNKKRVTLLDTSLPYLRTVSFTKTYGYSFDSYDKKLEPENGENVRIEISKNEGDALEKYQAKLKYFSFTKCTERDTVENVSTHIVFFENGLIKEIGQYRDSLSEGLWHYYNQQGKIEKVEQYTKGKKHYALFNEDGYVFFSVLVDKENGKLLQYKNDYMPDIRPNSLHPYLVFFFEYLSKCTNKYETDYGHFVRVFNDKKEKEEDSLFFTMIHKEYWKNGRLKSYGFKLPDGKKTGIWTDFSVTGDTVIVQDYFQDQPYGLFAKFINDELIKYQNDRPKNLGGERSYSIYNGVIHRKIYN